MIVTFWWGATENENRIHWKKWSVLCQPKFQGGMGFQDFICFNQSLLAKQVWRILNEPNSLAAQIYKKIFFLRVIFYKQHEEINLLMHGEVCFGEDIY